MRVRAEIAERVPCPVDQAPESAQLRGEGIRFDAVDVLTIISALEQSFNLDMLEVRALAFNPQATVGDLIDCVEGAMSGGIRS